MKTYFKLLLVLVLLACFCFQVWDGFFKFIKRQTTIVTKKTVVNSVRLPAISFCTGFKDKSQDYYDRSEELGESLYDKDIQSPMELWLDNTYTVGEILEFIKPPGPWHHNPAIVLNQTGFYSSANITLHELSTVYGRCYALHFSKYLITNSEYYFTLRFNMTNHEKLLLYIHEDYNEVGQHWGHYPIMPTQVIIDRKADYTMSVKKNLFKPFDNEGCRKEKNYSYPECVVNWARKRYVQMFTESNKTACWLPDTTYYAMDSGLMECPTKDLADWARSNTYDKISEQLGKSESTGCARRCIRNDLVVTAIREPENTGTSNGESSYVYYLGNFESDEDEEVVLYDFNNILAAMGGSLGLFLGVSVFSIIVHISNMLVSCITSKKVKSKFSKIIM